MPLLIPALEAMHMRHEMTVLWHSDPQFDFHSYISFYCTDQRPADYICSQVNRWRADLEYFLMKWA